MVVGLQIGWIPAVVFLNFGVTSEKTGLAHFIFFATVSGFLVIFAVIFLQLIKIFV